MLLGSVGEIIASPLAEPQLVLVLEGEVASGYVIKGTESLRKISSWLLVAPMEKMQQTPCFGASEPSVRVFVANLTTKMFSTDQWSGRILGEHTQPALLLSRIWQI